MNSVTRSSMTILDGPSPRRGRRRSPEPGSRVTTWIPAREHDRIIKAADGARMSVSAYVRHLITVRPK